MTTSILVTQYSSDIEKRHMYGCLHQEWRHI